MMHPDVTAAVARERIADFQREAKTSAPQVDAPSGRGPGGGNPSTRLEALIGFLGRAGAPDSWMPRPRVSPESAESRR
ncbi:hypothetical protein [Nocardiopsis suaedae]|uniref:Uncharacterized protein n=1 Tax=Nocardiopsis suaedae TaxID=3018444 RepID=A0ABT4TTG2_9ACTN|nr:hypothetical protein [Nocardiopsis suaedae]MDA2807986.1 hypothetical protein [Nocardiopsis suaedae]